MQYPYLAEDRIKEETPSHVIFLYYAYSDYATNLLAGAVYCKYFGPKEYQKRPQFSGKQIFLKI